MKHTFKPVPCALGIGFNAECSISGHRIADQKTGHPRRFIARETAERFVDNLKNTPMSEHQFKACVTALLFRRGAHLLREEQYASGIHQTFSLSTQFGSAEVTPLDSMAGFHFIDADLAVAWGIQDKCPWNLHSTDGDLRQLLCEFADGLDGVAVENGKNRTLSLMRG